MRLKENRRVVMVERPMVEFLIKLLLVARSKLKSRARLEAENKIGRIAAIPILSGFHHQYLRG
jgi:hypothetical protein